MKRKILEIFATNLRNCRQAAGLSQEKLADLCELHRTYISDVERAERNISIANIEKIADALDISAYELLKEEK